MVATPKQNKQARLYYKGIVDLCNLDVKAINWHYTARIKTANGDFPIDKVSSFDITKDYEIGFTDNFVIDVLMLKKHYIQTLYPLRNNFQVELTLTQVGEKEDGMKVNNPKKVTEVYRGFLVNPQDLGQSTQSTSTPSNNTDPNADTTQINVKIQLLHPSIEIIMKTTFGGNFHGVPGEIVKCMLSKVFEDMQIPKGGKRPEGVDLIPPDNTKETTDVVIPHDTNILDLPRKIQNEWYGIYNYGIGSYLHNNIWYLYPLYNYRIYDKSKTRLVINVMPKSEIMDSPRTYHVYNREVNIICAGGVESQDNANTNTTNTGDGNTQYDPGKLREESVQQTPEGVYINPSSAKKQFVQSKREDDLNYAPLVKERLTTSLQKTMSNIAQKNGIALSFVWEYANPFLLVPGMPVKVVYFKEDVKYELMGVLLKQVGAFQLVGNQTTNKHLGSVGLAVLVDQDQFNQKEKQQYKSTTAGVGKSLISNVLSIFK